MKTRTLFLTTFFMLVLQALVQAQTPQGISYQAIARDGTSVLNGQTIDVRFTVLQGGNPVYVETHSVLTNNYGLFTTTIGKGLPVSGTFSNIDWSLGNYSLKVEIDPDATGFVNMGTSPMESVPFSLYAETAGSVTNVGVGDLSDVIAPVPDSGDVLKWDGMNWISSPDKGTTVFPGLGIDIVNDTIINTGDADGTDDITIGSVANGDLAGTFPDPTVIKIQGRDVSGSSPANNDVLKWDAVLGEWRPQPDNVTTGTGNGVNVTGRISGDGAGTPLDIAQQGATNGQVLKWDGTKWAPAVDDGFQTLTLTGGTVLTIGPNGNSVNLPFINYQEGPGIDISGSIISNSGDRDSTNDITIGTPAGGDLTGFYPNPTVARIRNNAISSNIPFSNQVLKFVSGQWTPAADEVTDPDSDPNNEIQTLSISGNTLILSNGGGSAGLPVYTGGTGINVVGTTINNSGDINPADDITIGYPAAGDLAGTFPNPIVTKIHNRQFANTVPNNGYIYKWDSNIAQWVPSPDDDTDADADPSNELQTLSLSGNTLSLSSGGGSVNIPLYTGGSGINVLGTTIVNTGDLNASDDITIGTPASGDLTGTYPDPVVASLNGNPISNVSPNTNQVLKWNGAQWVPLPDDNIDADANPSNELQSLSISGNNLSLSQGGGTVSIPTYGAGTGISINASNTIINTGDVNPLDDITIGTQATGDLSGQYPSPTVAALQGKPVSNASPSTPGQVLEWNGAQWQPGADDINDADSDPNNELQSLSISGNTISLSGNGGSVQIPVYSAGPGINVSGTTIINTGDLNPNDDILINSAASGDLGGTFPSPTVGAIQGKPVSSTNPSNNDILKWNGTQWIPTIDEFKDDDSDDQNEIQTLTLSGTTLNLSNNGGSVILPYTAGTGIQLSGAVINNTGDTNPFDDLTINSNAAGDVSGTFSSLTVNRILNRNIDNTAPLNNQVYKWSTANSQWEPSNDEVNDADSDPGNEIQQLSLTGTSLSLSSGGGSVNLPVYTPGTGIDISSNVVTNTGDTNAGDDITVNTPSAGDVSGNFPTLTVTALQGNPVSTTAPSAIGQTLEWDGAEWVPGVDDNTTYSAGTGISINALNVVTNTGDTNPLDDVTLLTPAGGDASGSFTNLTITGLQTAPIDPSLPTSAGQVLKWNGSSWAPGTDDGTTYTAGTGIDVSGTVITNLGDTDGTDDILNTTIAAGDVTGTFSTMLVEGLQGNPVSATAPTASGQVLKWNGSSWAPGTDDGTTYTAGTGIDVSGTVITNLGDTDGTDDILNTTVAAGDVTGTFSTMLVEGLQGNPVSATAPTASGQVLKWNGTSWAPGTDDGTTYTAGTGIDVSGTVITNLGDTDGTDDILNTTVAAGDVTGTFSTMLVEGLQGSPVSATAPTTTGQVLRWNGSAWEPGTDAVNTYTAGTGIDVSGTVITNLGDTDGTDDILNTSVAAGDVTGTFSTMLVEGLQGSPVSATAPTTNGQVLKWNGTSWAPGTDDGTTYSAGSGIDVTGTVITNLGDTDGTDDILNTTVAAGDVSGTFSTMVVEGLQGNPVSSNAPTATGQVLKWNGTAWAPGTDDGTNYTAGTGINVAGTVITNTGDTNPGDDITTSTFATGDLSGFYPTPTVVAIQGKPVTNAAPANNEVLKWNGTQWDPGVDEVNDADADATNEIQTLSISGNTLNLSNGGGSVPYPPTYTAGSGIALSGTQIINIGDNDASDDITNTSVAGGDVSGNFSGLTVEALQGNPVSNTAPTIVGQVLEWNGTEWVPGTDDGVLYSSGNYIDITGGVITNTGDTSNVNEIQTLSISGTTLFLSNGGGSVPLPYSEGTGIDITGGIITNTGDTDASDDITDTSIAGGDVSGTFSTLTVEGLQGVGVSATAPAANQALVFDGAEWAPANADINAADDITTSTAASGDVSGTFPTLTVSGLQGTGVSNTAPALNEVLKFDGVNWVPAVDDTATYVAGTGITISGNTINNAGDANPLDDITTSTAAAGDVSGTFPTLTVSGLQGTGVSNTAPSSNQVLKFDGVNWAPAVDDTATYVAGTGITISGNTINNAGDANPLDDITTSTAAAGDVSGTFPTLTVAGLQGTGVSNTAPSSSQVLKFDGVNWAPAEDDTATYVAGTGITISGNTINNAGDANPLDDITTSTVAAGDVSGTFPTLTVAGLQGTSVANTAPVTSEILTFNGTDWTPDSMKTSSMKIDSDILATDNAYNLGGASNRWIEVFAVNGVINTSDIREKNSVENISYGLEHIMQLRPVSFKWNSRPELGLKLGLIAQEVEPVIGEVVKTHQYKLNPENGLLEEVELDRFGINYTDLIPVIIKGIQEQQTELETQKGVIEKQQDMIESLEERIRLLEEKIK